MFDGQKLIKILRATFVWSKGFFALLGFLVFINFIILAVILGGGEGEKKIEIKDNAVVTYSFKDKLPEAEDNLSFNKSIFSDIASFYDLLTALKSVKEDARVKFFVANLKDVDMSYAQVQELRGMIKDLSASGKTTIAFASDFGDGSSSFKKYYLASSFSQVYMQPVGAVAVNGIAAEIPFIKTLLDKVGIKPDFLRKGKYKSFPETFDSEGMSPDARKMMVSIINDISNQAIDDIAKDRKKTKEDFKTIVDKGLYSDDEALKLGLVDKLGYYDDIFSDKSEPIELEDYIANAKGDKGKLEKIISFIGGDNKKNKGENKKIALVIAEGSVVEEGKNSIEAYKIAEDFDDIIKDDKVAAIVLRLDTPGGSPVASEIIRHAIVKAKAKDKKVVVSMSGVTASGGYWIASAADKIIAQPATMTGSIGVFGGKLVLKDMWQKLGINWDEVSFGENARMWSTNKNFTAKEKERYSAIMDNIYNSFISRVADGRKMSREDVLAVAEGRVWTGNQAKQHKLIDGLGGIFEAVKIAKQEAGFKEGEKAEVVMFPKKKSGIDKIMDMIGKDISAFSGFLTFVQKLQTSMNIELK